MSDVRDVTTPPGPYAIPSPPSPVAAWRPWTSPGAARRRLFSPNVPPSPAPSVTSYGLQTVSTLHGWPESPAPPETREGGPEGGEPSDRSSAFSLVRRPVRRPIPLRHIDYGRSDGPPNYPCCPTCRFAEVISFMDGCGGRVTYRRVREEESCLSTEPGSVDHGFSSPEPDGWASAYSPYSPPYVPPSPQEGGYSPMSPPYCPL